MCKTSSIIKSRARTTWVSCLELEQAFSPVTGGVLITPGICITSRFLFCGGPCETSTSFLLRRENEFSISATTQIPFINSSRICFLFPFCSPKPARNPLPSQKHTCYKVSPSQHRFTKPDLSYSSLSLSLSPYWCVSSVRSPRNFHTLLLLLSSCFFINSSFHTFFLFVFSSPKISYKDCATTDGRYMFMFTDSVHTQPFIHLCLGPKWSISIS